MWDVRPRLHDASGPSGTLFAQVMRRDAGGMVSEAKRFNNAVPGIVVKVPVTAEGLAAIKQLKKEGIVTLGTAVYSAAQGLLAALAGAKYVAPYVNRVDAQGGDGIRMVQELQTLLKLHAPQSNVLAASFKTPRQALDRLLQGTGIRADWRGQTASLAPPATQLAPLTGTAMPERPDAPLVGFVARRATTATQTDTPPLAIPPSHPPV